MMTGFVIADPDGALRAWGSCPEEDLAAQLAPEDGIVLPVTLEQLAEVKVSASVWHVVDGELQLITPPEPD